MRFRENAVRHRVRIKNVSYAFYVYVYVYVYAYIYIYIFVNVLYSIRWEPGNCTDTADHEPTVARTNRETYSLSRSVHRVGVRIVCTDPFPIGSCCVTSAFLLVISIRACSNGRVNNSETVGAVARPCPYKNNDGRAAPVHGTPLSQPRVCTEANICAAIGGWRNSIGAQKGQNAHKGKTKFIQPRKNSLYF